MIVIFYSFIFVVFERFLLVVNICWLLCWDWNLWCWFFIFLFIFICVILITDCFLLFTFWFFPFVRDLWVYLFWFLYFVVMVMIIFNLIMFFNVKVSLFFNFFNPIVYLFWVLVIDLLFIIFNFIYFFFFFPYFFCWGGLGYIFGCDLISYGLILLSLWICVLIILSRESVFRLGCFSGFFVFVVIALTIILFCTFRRISLLSFYIFLESRLIPTYFFNFGLRVPTWACSGWYLFIVLYFVGLSTLVGWYFIYL